MTDSVVTCGSVDVVCGDGNGEKGGEEWGEQDT